MAPSEITNTNFIGLSVLTNCVVLYTFRDISGLTSAVIILAHAANSHTSQYSERIIAL